MAVKAGLLYSKDNFWYNPENGEIGISDYAQEQLGEIAFVDLSLIDEGSDITAGEPIPDASIESSKTVADIIAPVSGSVTAINGDELEDEPESLNESPYDKWLIKVDASSTDGLMDAAAYEAHLASL